ncbi:MAG: dCTP deaminase [Chloroflexi bacterium]|nr:dCTP deaminase [Chloroflexota bacterium]
MYLTNTELQKIHPEVIVECANPAFPFQPEEQIRVCSIDIRIDRIFWRMKRLRSPVHLTRNKLLEISPRRWWKKVVLDDQGSIKIKPGEFILGRTYEKISIPDNLAGRIMTRSSYSRLGLSTDCTCDLLNPGWEGHVPLELINNSPNTIVLKPYLPLSQIMLMPLSGEVDSNYGSSSYKSKYLQDDGGPSYWWRDSLVQKLHTKLAGVDVSNEVIDGLTESIEGIDDQALFRLERLLDDESFTNAPDVLERFRAQEKKRQQFYKFRRLPSLWSLPAFIAVSLSSLVSSPFGFWHFLLWGLTGASLLPFIYYVVADQVKFYPE